MDELGRDLALQLTAQTLWVAMLLAAPIIGISTLVGIAISILQTVTQIQESSITFVPKLVAAALVLLLLGGWMMSTLAQFATQMIGSIPGYF